MDFYFVLGHVLVLNAPPTLKSPGIPKSNQLTNYSITSKFDSDRSTVVTKEFIVVATADPVLTEWGRMTVQRGQHGVILMYI